MPFIPTDESHIVAIRDAIDLTSERKCEGLTQECPKALDSMAKTVRTRCWKDSCIGIKFVINRL